MKKELRIGMDISSLPSLIEKGLYSLGTKEGFLSYLKSKGVDSIRLRLFVDPSDDEGNSYGGGHTDLLTVLDFAKKLTQLGLDFVLDFHYSDFWADPGKQFLPKAWKDLTFDALINKIYHYTREVLLVFYFNKVKVSSIQIGNEITNGMLWPHGKLYENGVEIEGGFDRLGLLLKSASRAVREIYPTSEVILHLDRGGDKKLYQEWFSRIEEQHVEFDTIGLSYYPYWHGTLDDLEENIKAIQKRFKKKIMIMETSYAYTNKIANAPLVVSEKTITRSSQWPPYPFTKEGQKAFMVDLITKLKQLNVDGLYYWEPAWLFLSNDTWATKEGREYIKETHKSDGNEWANQALFDEHGDDNPVLEIFNQLKGDR